jgi:hypothetical protein
MGPITYTEGGPIPVTHLMDIEHNLDQKGMTPLLKLHQKCPISLKRLQCQV